MSNNIQDILDNIGKKFRTNTDVGTFQQSKLVYVFKDGKLLETLPSSKIATKKYGHAYSYNLKMKRPIKGLYITTSPIYDVKEPNRSKLSSKKTQIRFIDGTTQDFETVIELSMFLKLKKSNVSAILRGKRNLPKKLSNVEKIYFLDAK